MANVQFGYSETLVRIIQNAEKCPGQPIIWFLDEFNRGSQAVQSELMNLVLQRQINALRLPDQVKMIIAENPDSTMPGFADREYDVAIGDAAIKDRTVQLVMTTSTTEWLEWATHRQPAINQLVVKYLTAHPDRLVVIDDNDPGILPTPRAWERVSTNLDQLEKQPRAVQQGLAGDLFAGDLGPEVGASFAQFVLNQGSELTLAGIQNTDQGVVAFNQADEATKLTLLRRWVADSPASLSVDSGAKRFVTLLNSVSADGQVAVAKSIGEADQELLATMYRQAKQDIDGPVAKLYRRLAEIATRGDNH